MTDPTDRFVLGDAPGTPPDAEPLARWIALRAAVARDLDAALPDRDALVLAGLDAAQPDALDAADRARLAAARPLLDAACTDHPAVADALARVGRDAAAFDAAWTSAPPGRAPGRTSDVRRADRPAVRPDRGLRRWLVRGVSLAAVVAFAAVAAFTLLRDRGFESLAATDAVRTVALADGSAATLAPGTTLLARVDGSGPREVRLRTGEALFDVARDPARPFTVETDNARTTVLGTVFTVRTDGVRTDVLLVSGSVDVAPRGGEAVRLAPGERSHVVALDAPSAPARADVAAALAWTGRVVARETAARDVAARLSEAFGAEVAVDDALAAETVSGTFGAAGLDDAAQTLARALGGRVERAAGGLRIVPAE